MPKHILLVEDDEPLAATLSTILQRAGCRVTVTSHFDTALKALEGSDAVDLLVADIVIPASLNGVALARMAPRMGRHDLPVIYMTAYDIPGVDREALGPVLRKPVDSETLLGAVNKLLESQPSAAQR
jgi:CheY-like chemotaxis protein